MPRGGGGVLVRPGWCGVDEKRRERGEGETT